MEQIAAAQKRTPLFEKHKIAGARFVPFGGWEMPVQYSGIIEEHHTVRNAAGLFDVSHMGELYVVGPDAVSSLQNLVSSDISSLSSGCAKYGLLLNQDGGVVDDVIVYRMEHDAFILCVNASNTDKDFNWVKDNLTQRFVSVENRSEGYGQLAVQGPRAREIVAKAFGGELSEFDVRAVPFLHFIVKRFQHALVIVSATGYTGEDGFELFCPAQVVGDLWDALLDVGTEFGLKPIGLGARDTLRFEACYPLYGHELRDELDPYSAGLGWAVARNKESFIGKEALEKLLVTGSGRKLVGLEVVDRGIVREGTEIFSASNEDAIGWVTSGTMSPTFGKALAMAYVQAKYAKEGTEVVANVRGKKLKVKVVKKPFYLRK